MNRLIALAALAASAGALTACGSTGSTGATATAVKHCKPRTAMKAITGAQKQLHDGGKTYAASTDELEKVAPGTKKAVGDCDVKITVRGDDDTSVYQVVLIQQMLASTNTGQTNTYRYAVTPTGAPTSSSRLPTQEQEQAAEQDIDEAQAEADDQAQAEAEAAEQAESESGGDMGGGDSGDAGGGGDMGGGGDAGGF